jgi:cell division protein FtsZ
VQESAHPEANIIFGTVIDDSLGDEVRVTVIAAGFDSGTPTHKKLDPTVVGSRTPAAAPTATAQAGEVTRPATPPTPTQPPPTPPSVPQPAPQVQPATQYTPPSTIQQPPSQYAAPRSERQNPNLPGQRATGFESNRPGHLPGRAVPVTDDPDDEVDVPPFMRR